ncbi:MAG: hypothetical protein R3223_03105 [Longimicrobiales bacterium]|nr:hypothetical protein [Longimicrobiales bacterium]
MEPTRPGMPRAREESVGRSAYDAYVRRQAREFLDLIPREGLRPLYGRARAWAREQGLHDEKDPLATLLRFCEVMLPLPPFHVWLEDVHRNSDAHVDELRRTPEGRAGDQESVPVETRTFIGGRGDEWRATLSLYRAKGAWRGLIRFRRERDDSNLCTAAIFREDDPEEIRGRFRSFDEPALEAFLRSVEP